MLHEGNPSLSRRQCRRGPVAQESIQDCTDLKGAGAVNPHILMLGVPSVSV